MVRICYPGVGLAIAGALLCTLSGRAADDSALTSPPERKAVEYTTAALSPTADRVALVRRIDEKWSLEIRSLQSSKVMIAPTGRLMDISRVEWADDDHILCWIGYDDRYFLGVWVLSLAEGYRGETRQLTGWGTNTLVATQRMPGLSARPYVIMASNPNEEGPARLVRIFMNADFSTASPARISADAWLMDGTGAIGAGLSLGRKERGVWLRPPDDQAWIRYDLPFDVLPVGFVGEGELMLAVAPDDAGYLVFRHFDPRTGRLGDVVAAAENRDVIPWSLMRGQTRTLPRVVWCNTTNAPGRLIAVRVPSSDKRVHWLDAQWAAADARLRTTYQGLELQLLDYRPNQKVALVFSRAPGVMPEIRVLQGEDLVTTHSFPTSGFTVNRADEPVVAELLTASGLRPRVRLFEPPAGVNRVGAIVCLRCDPHLRDVSSVWSGPDDTDFFAQSFTSRGMAVLELLPDEGRRDATTGRRQGLGGVALMNAWTEQAREAAAWLMRERHVQEENQIALLGSGLAGTAVAFAAIDRSFGATVILGGYYHLRNTSELFRTHRDQWGVHSLNLWFPDDPPADEARALSPNSAARVPRGPVLLLHHIHDWYVRFEQAETFHRRIRRAGGTADLWRLDQLEDDARPAAVPDAIAAYLVDKLSAGSSSR